MNGFNPLNGLKNWHVYLTIVLALFGIAASIYFIGKAVIYFYNHTTFNL